MATGCSQGRQPSVRGEGGYDIAIGCVRWICDETSAGTKRGRRRACVLSRGRGKDGTRGNLGQRQRRGQGQRQGGGTFTAGGG